MRALRDDELLLAERLITAEQDERRRLSLLLHDGPLQELSGITLMHDAALTALNEGRYEEAADIMTAALKHERKTIQSIRDLSLAIEPVLLRDYGFKEALESLVNQLERDGAVSIKSDIDAGNLFPEKMQAVLYQTVREALGHSAQRDSRSIHITINRKRDMSFLLKICDNGYRERRRDRAASIEERARMLQASVTLESTDSGTTVMILIPETALKLSDGNAE
tara:strand:- start:112 stop:780 length:669 start_codon:yes stop_codon:yes gene_type:complete